MDLNTWAQSYDRYIEQLPDGLDGVCFIGGTALSLCYLQHRISEDLDFMYQDESFDDERIPAEIAGGIHGDYYHDQTLMDRTGEWFGERWYLEDGESKVKIDVVTDRLLDGSYDTEPYKTVPLLTRRDLYRQKVHLIAQQNEDDPMGLGKGRSRNIRDWIDVYELSTTHRYLSGFMLDEMELDESDITNIGMVLDEIDGQSLRHEMSDLQYTRDVSADTFKSHFDEQIDTWLGYQVDSHVETGQSADDTRHTEGELDNGPGLL